MRRYWIAMPFVAAAALIVVLAAAHFTDTHPRVTQPRVQHRAVYTYAQTFAGTVNAYARAHHQPPIRKVTCLRGNPGHYFCAFTLGGTCRGAFVQDDSGEVNVEKAGKVAWLTPSTCTARNVFRQAWKG